ncbi:hypothetical protein ASG25_02930 [Rhizobium sp. Leaf384]|uniref:KTSC domain-containing protein n=1 Tax=unclassified Rhizobium TaxID=2613769 RepID=UPI000713AED6|nr:MULTISPECIES: KTSC domain-containing protein [unclassified Rhizobium]KQS80553.1 hypothetical protein ASG25_02930 [Rhizobium sp. Leaf384]KQS86604.1 hypothetical protein ASG58_18005 [Rhizobium sp. Leaf383]
MLRLHVESRIIHSVYFSQEDGQLRICFKNGEERRFIGVPEAEAAAMCEAPSPGQHYIAKIRNEYDRLAA